VRALDGRVDVARHTQRVAYTTRRAGPLLVDTIRHDVAVMGDRMGGVRWIVVMGLMGVGKTTIGRLLADRLGWPLRDSDAEIAAATLRTVRELRDEIGVDAMHELEVRQVLDALDDPGPVVIAPAAAVIDVEACRVALRAPGVTVIFLTAAPEVLAARFLADDHRPWYGTDPATFLADQAAARDGRFRSLDPIELTTDDRTPDDVADAIIVAVRERSGAAFAPGGAFAPGADAEPDSD
jgi:shikimate kinase